jgi:hypothetical protein
MPDRITLSHPAVVLALASGARAPRAIEEPV